MQPLVPLYDLSYADKIVTAAKSYKIGVIVNPNDGPGTKVDSAWKKVISTLSANHNVTLFGYVDMVTWNSSGSNSTPKSLATLSKERQDWRDYYGVLKYFLDDWGSKMTRPFSEVCIANPGCDMKTPCDYTLVWETDNYLKSKAASVDGGKSAVFSMHEKNYKDSLDLAKKRGIYWFYAVEAPDDWHAYDKLPSYFDDLIKNTK